MPNNFQRMIQMAADVFDAYHDPEQLDVDQDVIRRLHQLHPASVAEDRDDDGPTVWILLIPTTTAVMDAFIKAEISEKALLDQTPLSASYDAIYLCSAMVLPEYRNKGIATKLTLDSIEAIKNDHPITTLFVWPFTKEGNALALKIAKLSGLPLKSRKGR